MAFADFTLAMMALFMTLWIVNSVSKADRENIVAALHGQSIFNGGGMAPLNKLGKQPIAPGAQKKNVTRNKLDKTVNPQETAKITEENAKRRWM